MKTYLKPFILLLMASTVFFMACEEEAESPAPEEAAFPNAFSFKLDNYDVTMSQGAPIGDFRANTNPEIKFKKDKDLGSGKLKVDLHEFIEESMKEVWTKLSVGASVSITINDFDDLVAKVAGNRQFEIDTFEFTLFLADTTGSYAYEFSAEGKFDTAKISMEFEMITPLTGSGFSPVLYVGTAEGKRNQ